MTVPRAQFCWVPSGFCYRNAPPSNDHGGVSTFSEICGPDASIYHGESIKERWLKMCGPKFAVETIEILAQANVCFMRIILVSAHMVGSSAGIRVTFLRSRPKDRAPP